MQPSMQHSWTAACGLLISCFLSWCLCANLEPSFKKPIVITTWSFVNASNAAWDVLDQQLGSAVNAVVAGGTKCEDEQCDYSVGFGGSPDENGESALDAMIMDGSTFDVGAVANLRNIKNAIGVAHAVMKHTRHTLLVGSLATEFAVQMGFKLTNLSTTQSVEMWKHWRNRKCQPNYWQNVYPDPRENCGPYSPHVNPKASFHEKSSAAEFEILWRSKHSAPITNHDTIGVVAIDRFGNVAGGTSTNGATFKIPGRVGDSPIVGSGAYADNAVGGAAATGDGDIMMRFLPSFLTVELMRNGKSPAAAAAEAVQRIARVHLGAHAAVVALNMDGEYGASCLGFSKFSYTVMSPDFSQVQVIDVPCSSSP